MTQLNQVYSTIIQDFLTKNTYITNSTILVLKGFSLEFYKTITELGITHFSNSWGGDYPNVEHIENRELLFAANIYPAERLSWMFYEEFILLTDIITDFKIFKFTVTIVENNLHEKYYPVPLPNDEIDFLIHVLDDESNQTEGIASRKVYCDYKIVKEVVFFSYIQRHNSIDVQPSIQVLDMYLPKTNAEPSICTTVKPITSAVLPSLAYLLERGLLAADHYVVTNDNSKQVQQQIAVMNTLGSFYETTFNINIEAFKEKIDPNEYLPILKAYWGVESTFRDCCFYKNPGVDSEKVYISQGRIVTDILHQCKQAKSQSDATFSDIIVTAPTGAGKSLFFQIPAIHLHEEYGYVTIVISPLIALMADQVNELEEKGITFSTFINSSITYEERLKRIKGLQQGKFSLLYLAPELLLAYDIHSLLGNRQIGLLVIDEAHLVTSWGRDFRVDYWFLGDHLEKLRRGSYYSKEALQTFPILCLTATAVYGGRDDVVGELQDSLHLTCYDDHMYIGNVRRDNIIFNTRHPQRSNKSVKDEKIALTTQAIHSFLQNSEKTIVYFPFKSQIRDIELQLNMLYPSDQEKISIYHGGEMPSIEKDKSYNAFRSSKSLIMMATKAFGMGVNIADIQNVYHFAPTGTLADYIQEIGRAARDKDITGQAITDFLYSDMHYARTLWGLSGLKQYQLRAILKRLYALYSEDKKRNLLIAPETFSYLFDESNVDQKVKSGFMLLCNDLMQKYHFKVITVKPRTVFTKQFINVPNTVTTRFMEEYGCYCKAMNDDMTITKYEIKPQDSYTICRNGKIYEIDFKDLWEKKFNDKTFDEFKYQFFKGDLFSYEKKISPFTRLEIQYSKGYDNVVEKLTFLAEGLQNTFMDIKRTKGGRQFSFSEFYSILTKTYGIMLGKEHVQLLLDSFCYDSVDPFYKPSMEWKFILKRKSSEASTGKETTYAIKQNRYAYISNNLKRYLRSAKPNIAENSFVIYISIQDEYSDTAFFTFLANILQLTDLATYQYSGGRNPAIFVRINDPLKIRRLVESDEKYRNNPLREIQERHKRAITVMNAFMGKKRSSDSSWEIVENYFLGKDALVDTLLGITQEAIATDEY